MSDLISRQDLIDAINAYANLDEYYHNRKCKNIPIDTVRRYLKEATPLEGLTGVIRCKDCKWWRKDKTDDPYGYCYACKSGTYTEHWEISIRRKYKGDFFCADAEPIRRDNGDDDPS